MHADFEMNDFDPIKTMIMREPVSWMMLMRKIDAMSLFGQDNAPHGKKGKQLNSEVIVSSRQDSSPM